MFRVQQLLAFFTIFLSLLQLHAETDLNLTSAEKAWLKNHPVIKVANETDWPPIDFVRNGNPAGLSIDYANLIAKKLNIRIEYINGYSWTELLQMAKDKKLDLVTSIVNTRERREYLHFTKGYILNPVVIYIHEDSQEIDELELLEGQTLAVVKNYYQQELLRRHYPKINQLTVSSLEEGLKAVAFKKAYGIISNSAPADYIIQNKLLTSIKVGGELTNEHFYAKELCLAVRKDWPIFRDILNKALASLTYQEERHIKQRWLSQIQSENTLRLTPEEKKWLTNNPEIFYAGDPSWLPVSGYDENGNYIGIVPDFIELVAQQSGIKLVNLRSYSWSETLDLLKQRKVHFIDAMTSSRERRKTFSFTEPFLTLDFAIITRGHFKYVPDLYDLIDKKVATPKGYVTEEYLRRDYPTMDLTVYNNIEEGLRAVSEGKVNAFITDIASYDYFSKKLSLHNLKISGLTKYRTNLSFATNKHDKELHSILNKALKKIPPQERLKIYRKWISLGYTKFVDYSLVWKTLAYSAITIILISLWLLQLRNQKNRLQKSEERFQLAMESSFEGLFDWDVNAGTFYCNPTFTKMLGYNSDFLKNFNLNSLKSLIHKEDIKRWDANISSCLYGKKDSISFKFRLKCADTQYRHILCHAKAVKKSPSGKALRIIGTHQDIEKQVSYEQKLLEARNMSEAANKAKSKFLANMSHEIRTPMNAILGFSELLLAKETNPKRQKYIESIYKSGNNLLKLINEILDLSKIEAGKMTADIEKVSVRNLISEIYATYNIPIHSKGLKFDINLAEKIPHWLHTDPQKLKQIIINFISNALKFTKYGNITLSVDVSFQERYCDLSITVADTGVGIPKKDLETIFSAFEQATDSNHMNEQGTGLGLSIAQKLAQLLNGNIEVQSTVNKGSIFTLTLFSLEYENDSTALYNI